MRKSTDAVLLGKLVKHVTRHRGYGNCLGDVFDSWVPTPKTPQDVETSVCASVLFRVPCPHSMFASVFVRIVATKGTPEKVLKPNGYKEAPEKE